MPAPAKVIELDTPLDSAASAALFKVSLHVYLSTCTEVSLSVSSSLYPCLSLSLSPSLFLSASLFVSLLPSLAHSHRHTAFIPEVAFFLPPCGRSSSSLDPKPQTSNPTPLNPDQAMGKYEQLEKSVWSEVKQEASEGTLKVPERMKESFKLG